MDISKFPINNSPLGSNSWLTGFLDADGGFYIRYPKNILCKFHLEQRMIYPKTKESYLPILSQVSLFFNVKLTIRKRFNYKNSYYIIRVENKNSIKIFIFYLKKYPLLSSKHLDFLEWEKSFCVIVDKLHNTEQGKEIIWFAKKNKKKTKKNNMNDKRNYFNWDHLYF